MTNIPSNSPSVSSDSLHMPPQGAGRMVLRWSAGCVALALAACASVAPSTPQEQVTQRANARWKLMVAKEIDKAYAYTTPGFRGLVSTESYRGRFGAATWLDAEVARVNCPEAAKCNVVVRLEFKPVLGGKSGDRISTHLDETWILEDGQWWLFENIKAN